MGMYCELAAVNPSAISAVQSGSAPESVAGETLSLEKAWHGLHFLLSGSAWDGELPQGFLLAGGEELGEDETRRILQPAEVRRIADALQAVSDDELWSRFDSRRMQSEEIYPQIWDEPESDLREEYLMYFNQLKRFLLEASARGQAIVIDIG
jgi:hypothetical protein